MAKVRAEFFFEFGLPSKWGSHKFIHEKRYETWTILSNKYIDRKVPASKKLNIITCNY